MSDTSLYSGLYRQIVDFAELVDQVLILILNGDCQRKESIRRLGQLIQQVSSNSTDIVTIKMITYLLRDNDTIMNSELARAADDLNSGKCDKVTYEILERLAQLLEVERAHAMGRIRGNFQ